jgi:hypothetical protein
MMEAAMKKIRGLLLTAGMVFLFFCGDCQGANTSTDSEYKIVFPDMNNGRIVIMDDMKGTNRRNITTVGSYQFKKPSWVTVDYKTGFIYVLDSTSATSNDSVLVKITSLNPSVPTQAVGSTVNLYNSNWTNPWIHGPTQAALDSKGDIIISELLYFSTVTESRLIRLAGFNPPQTSAVINPDESDGNGVAVLKNGKILRTYGPVFGSVGINLLEGFTLTQAGNFGTYTNGSGDTQLSLPTSIIADPMDKYVYISDTGNQRLVRLSTTGTGRVNFKPASGGKTWDEPRMVAVLPNRKILIEDSVQDVLVQIDSLETGLDSWESYDGGADPFDFGFYYEYS